jgi:hypothetical protein
VALEQEEMMTPDEFVALSRRNNQPSRSTSTESQLPHKYAYFFSHLDDLPASIQADVGDR